jgi:hypothetical protein
MTHSTTSLRRVILAALLVPVLALAMMASVPTSEAAPGANCIYYSDASKTTVVGKFGKDCCNNTIAWGVKTSHYTCSAGCFICYPPPID